MVITYYSLVMTLNMIMSLINHKASQRMTKKFTLLIMVKDILQCYQVVVYSAPLLVLDT